VAARPEGCRARSGPWGGGWMGGGDGWMMEARPIYAETDPERAARGKHSRTPARRRDGGLGWWRWGRGESKSSSEPDRGEVADEDDDDEDEQEEKEEEEEVELKVVGGARGEE
jgi:hypothetical protein